MFLVGLLFKCLDNWLTLTPILLAAATDLVQTFITFNFFPFFHIANITRCSHIRN